MKYKVIFQPSGCQGMVTEGKTILETLRELGVDIEAPCGGTATCGKCKIIVEEGRFEKYGIISQMSNLSPLEEKEKRTLEPNELAGNYRLACCTKVQGDILVFVPEESRGVKQVILETGTERSFRLNPAVTKYYVELEKATLEDYQDDYGRLCNALTDRYTYIEKDLMIDHSVLFSLPDVLRTGNWKVTATVRNNREIVAVEPGRVEKIYGMAVDVGTTTIAAYLCDLTTGEILKRDSMMNPQVRYGEDVLSRISYGMTNDGGMEKMHKAIVEGINILIARMTEEIGLTADVVVEMVLVFNTVMHHIVLNINPQYMGCSPFVPVIRKSLDIKARDLAIRIAKGGYIHSLPIEAGFVGADNVSVLIAEEPYEQDDMILIIDIGTNGEITFGNKEKIFSTSCATGPALEGAQMKFGMRAAYGAIEKVKIHPVSLESNFKVIGENEWFNESQIPNAKGICGSGIIDVVAEMYKSGIIKPTGNFNMNLSSPRIRRGEDGKPEYVLAWARETSIGRDITIIQKDVWAVQLAKAALYAGAKMLMKKMGVAKVDRVILAGAFGSYINPENALVMGMFPNCNLKNIVAVGNAAGEGAKLALLDVNKRIEAQKVAEFVEFVEAAIESDYKSQFANAMSFPHAKDSFSHVQNIINNIPIVNKKEIKKRN